MARGKNQAEKNFVKEAVNLALNVAIRAMPLFTRNLSKYPLTIKNLSDCELSTKEFKELKDEFKTMMTDNHKIIVRAGFVYHYLAKYKTNMASLTTLSARIAAGLLHELMHIEFLDFKMMRMISNRDGNMEMVLYNVCADSLINDFILNHFKTLGPQSVLMGEEQWLNDKDFVTSETIFKTAAYKKYITITIEEWKTMSSIMRYYHIMDNIKQKQKQKQNKNKKKQGQQGQQGQKGQGQGNPGPGNPGSGMPSDSGNPNPSNSGQSQQGGGNSGLSADKELVDELNKYNNNHKSDGDIGPNGEEDTYNMTSGNIEDDHNNAVVATASEMMKQQQDGIGNSHAMFKGMIDRLIKPRYNWKALLRKRMESGKSKIKNSDTNRKVSGLRSFIRGGALKFNNFGYNAEVIVVLDVSGSMHSGMIDALSEIAGMNRRREIRLITVDTQPMDDIMIKNDGIANAVSKDSFQMHLGGGTYISSAFEKLVKEKTRDSIIVNISDYEITSSDNNNLNLQIKRLRKKNNVIIELKVNDKVELINSTRRKK